MLEKASENTVLKKISTMWLLTSVLGREREEEREEKQIIAVADVIINAMVNVG